MANYITPRYDAYGRPSYERYWETRAHRRRDTLLPVARGIVRQLGRGTVRVEPRYVYVDLSDTSRYRVSERSTVLQWRRAKGDPWGTSRTYRTVELRERYAREGEQGE